MKINLAKVSAAFFFRCLIGPFLVSPLSAAMAEESNICTPLDMGLDVQAQFQGYKVAVCLRGMGPTHMVVINQSSDSSKYSIKTLPLQVVRQSSGREDSPTVGLRPESYVFYKSKEDGVVYEVDIQRDGSASFSILSGNTKVYSDWTVDVKYGDLVPPRK